MRYRLSGVGLLLVLFIIISCKSSTQERKSIVVFCAASLAPVMHEAKKEWELEHEVEIIINASSSGTLARQIEHGAKADLYFSANSDWTQYLIKSLDLEKSPLTIAANQLVVAAPIDTNTDIVDFDSFIKSLQGVNSKISMGNPGHVPLGKYTRQFLESYDVDDLLSEKFILAKDARSALRLIEMGEVDFGFIYRSDAMTSRKIKIIAQIPKESYDSIVYQALTFSDEKPADDFLKFIQSDDLKETWQSFGFSNIEQ